MSSNYKYLHLGLDLWEETLPVEEWIDWEQVVLCLGSCSPHCSDLMEGFYPCCDGFRKTYLEIRP